MTAEAISTEVASPLRPTPIFASVLPADDASVSNDGLTLQRLEERRLARGALLFQRGGPLLR